MRRAGYLSSKSRWIAGRPPPALGLEERIDNLGDHHVHGDDDLAPVELEARFRISLQDVFAAPYEVVDFIVQPILIAKELAVDMDLVAFNADHFHVADDVLEARDGLLGQWIPVLNWRMRPARTSLPSSNQLISVSLLVSSISQIAELDVPAHGHPVVEIVVHQRQPLVQLALVQKRASL